MTPERWKRTEALYHEALARTPADRAAFLAVACADDEAMNRHVTTRLLNRCRRFTIRLESGWRCTAVP